MEKTFLLNSLDLINTKKIISYFFRLLISYTHVTHGCLNALSLSLSLSLPLSVCLSNTRTQKMCLWVSVSLRVSVCSKVCVSVCMCFGLSVHTQAVEVGEWVSGVQQKIWKNFLCQASSSVICHLILTKHLICVQLFY